MAFSRSLRALLLVSLAISAASGVTFKAESATDAASAAAAVTAASTASSGASATATSASTASSASASSSTTTSSGSSTSTATVGKAFVAPSAASKHKGWLNPIVIKGNKLFDSKTGLEFRMRGMAYNPRPNDGELASEGNYDWTTDNYEDVWTPHLDILADLGVNTVRLYSVNPGLSHDKFMCACAARGIYVLVGMAATCENCAIQDLAPPACYPDELFTRMQMVYNAFAVYDNVLGFSVANENNLLHKVGPDGTQTMPCAKALLRDVRNYASYCQNKLRVVPIGIDLADTQPRTQWMQYMDCAIDSNEFTRAQWIGFNPYVECDPATHLEYSQSTGLITLMKSYDTVQYPRPLMFGEFGCQLGVNTIDGYEKQRAFYDAKWMNEEADMTKQIVGGNVFEFVTEIPNTVSKSLGKAADTGRYGVGYFQPLTCDHDKVPCQFFPYPEYANLKKAYTSTKASTLTMTSYTIDRTTVLTCPSNISSTLRAIPTVTTLECATAQPTCNGTKSNTDLSTAKAPALGGTKAASNTDSSTTSSNSSAAISSQSFVSVAVAVASAVAAAILA